MIKKLFLLIFCLGMIMLLQVDLLAQGRVYDGPEDGAGDPYLEREGFMVGNRVQLLFKNNTELGDYPRKDAVRWPRGVGGNVMHDGLGLLITAPVFITQDSIPITDTTQIRLMSSQGLIDTLFYCQTNYREEMDRDPTGQVEWGLHPAPGYSNTLSEVPAMSNDPNSWPLEGWLHDKSRARRWQGEWDGRFGRGQIKADLEAYIVANDAQDLEYLGVDDKIKYYPRPGINIGDFDPSVTVQKGKPWGGMGVRVKQRLFQWNNPMAQDCIFSEYTIANVSEYDLPYMAFGAWLDNDIGGENAGEDGSYDKSLNMSYQWDTDGVGEDGYVTGTAGYAYLESPGDYGDYRDNDLDGIIDERRDNLAQRIIPASEHIVNMDNYLRFYGLKLEDVKAEWWDADEDGDWNDGEDTNGDGIYQVNELSGDDVGLDGVAPGEENYTGPDIDGTEGNHRPDLSAGYAEPNFGWTDVSETDMLGLTTLLYTEAVPHTEPYTGWFRNDRSMWQRMTLLDSLESGATDINNLFELFSTAIFPLYKGNTEFISLSQLHSYDDLAGLNSAAHSAPALFTLKKTVQVIYEKDYRFAQPPKMPTLRAIPGDKFVQLVWDNRSDRTTREPFLGGVNDFEGYKVFRSTDPDFHDPQVITDGYGTKTLFKPIFQCDLKNGRRGFTTYGLLNGMAYNLGEDTGLAYSFKDNTVQNGRTYYYAVVAYDYGIRPDELKGSSVAAQDPSYGIAPSENNVVIRKNEFEEIEFIGPNVAVVTPANQAAGEVVQSSFDVKYNGSETSGVIQPEVIDVNSLQKGHEYMVKFTIHKIDSSYRYHAGYGYEYSTSGIRVYDQTEGNKLVFEDVVVKGDEDELYPKNMHSILTSFDNETAAGDDDYWHIVTDDFGQTEIFDGLQLNVKMSLRNAEFDYANTGWMPGESPINVIYIDESMRFFKWDYNIVFSDQPVYTSQLVKARAATLRDENGNKFETGALLFGQQFNFKIENINFVDSTGQFYKLDMVVQDLNKNGQFDMIGDRILAGSMNLKERWDDVLFIFDFNNCTDESQLPKPNDVYAIRHIKPWGLTDSVTFKVDAQKLIDASMVKSKMEEIRVVPNPYVASNLMEPSVVNKWLNQRRRLLFTNLPEKCTIRVFTVSGMLVRELHAPEDALTSASGFGQTNTGAMHWDMLTSEGLEVAAGMYFYHVKDDMTGEEIVGKFAVIK